jgi:hypothetical protein
MIGSIEFIVSTLAPSQLLKDMAQSLFAARGSSLPCTAFAALRPFVARGSSSSCMTYAANCPCGKGLIVIPSPVTILGKGFVVAFFGERLIVALLNGCVLLGVLAILALGNAHAVFGVLNLLAFGNVHASGNVHAISSVLAVPALGVFALLVIAWRDMVIIASCKQQHIIFDCCVGVSLVLSSHSLFIVIAPCDTT